MKLLGKDAKRRGQRQSPGSLTFTRKTAGSEDDRFQNASSISS